MSTLNAKLTALQLLGLAERFGCQYIETMGIWMLEPSEQRRLYTLRRHLSAITAYRMIEEALTDFEILLPEIPPVKIQFGGQSIDKRAIMTLFSENPTLSPEACKDKLLVLLGTQLAKQIAQVGNSPKASIDHWDKLVATQRERAELLTDATPARADSANTKLQLLHSWLEDIQKRSDAFISQEQATKALSALDQRRKQLSWQREEITIAIGSLTKSDENNPKLLTLLRLNQSVGVFLDQHLKTIAQIGHDYSDTEEEAQACFAKLAADNEDFGKLFDNTSDKVDLSTITRLSTKACDRIIDQSRPSTRTAFVEAATAELELAERLLTAANAVLK